MPSDQNIFFTSAFFRGYSISFAPMRSLCFCFLAVMLLLSQGCEKEKITKNADQLAFSTDTVLFDTVFTQIGTATRNFKVYNRGKGTLQISSIRLARTNSRFRINVDGLPGREFSNVEILPDDSMYIFVEATINPNGTDNPLVVTDSILFEVNGVVKDVDLVAWGQDANYIVADQLIPNLPPIRVLEPNAYWSSNKPYVIYGYAVVDSGNSLRIQEGANIHFHSGSGLWVYKGGKISVEGTFGRPVTFQGDRLEPAYENTPGQWDRIWINAGAENSTINYAVIKNGFIGIQAEPDPFDPLAGTSSSKLTIRNTIIQNSSGVGIFARNFRIHAENVVVVNSGQYGIGISGGGEYTFLHATVASYGFSAGQRKTPAFFMTNEYESSPDVYTIRPITNSRFVNCIFYGSLETEFDYSINQSVTNDFVFQNCLVKRKELINSPEFINLFYNQDPLFKNRLEYEWQLSEKSPALNKGIPTTATFDFTGTLRDENPDLGAYETP